VNRAVARVTTVGLIALLAVGCGKKKEEEAPIPAPPPVGQASKDELSTSLGQAKGLDEALAPTSVKWTRAFVLDEKRALLAGEVVNETIALFTDDAGINWRSFRAEKDAWSSWSVGLDGAVVLGVGSREGAPTPQSARVEGARIAFGTFDTPSLAVATPLFPTPKGPVQGLLQTVSAVPALLGMDAAALVAEDAPRKMVLLYGGKPGAEAIAPLKLPSGEKIVPVPYGRPPVMLSIKGKDLFSRPFPAPGKPLDKPQKVAGVAATSTLLGELSTPPLCETGAWSFQRVLAGAKKVQLLGVSPTKTVAFALPDSTTPTTAIGCGANRVVVETVQAKTGPPALQAEQPDVPMLVTCDLAGKCTAPKNPPFRMWPGPQKREITMAATTGGTLGVMSVRAGDRWGLYLGQSPDGITFERPRPIGEGTGDRGRIELGALLSFGKRALLLISADVTGTSRRGWFVLVSDDGGTSWNPP
jgi:hypothetical protein